MNPNNGEVKRCYVYARLSTEDQHRRVEYSSLDSQEKVCKAYIASQEPNGWKYVTTIKDLSSGGNTDRPGLQELIDVIKQGQVDIVVTTKMDRLTRNIKDFWTLYEIMQKHGCQFVCVTRNSTLQPPMADSLSIFSWALPNSSSRLSGSELGPRCSPRLKKVCGTVGDHRLAMIDTSRRRLCLFRTRSKPQLSKRYLTCLLSLDPLPPWPKKLTRWGIAQRANTASNSRSGRSHISSKILSISERRPLAERNSRANTSR